MNNIIINNDTINLSIEKTDSANYICNYIEMDFPLGSIKMIESKVLCDDKVIVIDINDNNNENLHIIIKVYIKTPYTEYNLEKLIFHCNYTDECDDYVYCKSNATINFILKKPNDFTLKELANIDKITDFINFINNNCNKDNFKHIKFECPEILSHNITKIIKNKSDIKMIMNNNDFIKISQFDSSDYKYLVEFYSYKINKDYINIETFDIKDSIKSTIAYVAEGDFSAAKTELHFLFSLIFYSNSILLSI
jgi:hypothetical protein